MNQIKLVTSFVDLVSTPLHGELNAIGWSRKLTGDFSEIVNKIESDENIVVISEDDLSKLALSEQGQLAREIILQDMQLLKDHGASPTLNLIRHYERDNAVPFFPTDVYSFHVDRSPIPTDTFLCTYYGESSEIIANSEAEQKIRIPEIRHELKKLHDGTEEEFETFLSEHFFDLHYRPKAGSNPIRLAQGQLWRLAVDHPGSLSLPCIHRAPVEKAGEKRLLLIC